MSQTIFSQDDAAVQRQYTNVAENWKLYDTVLIGLDATGLDFHTGYFASYAALGAVAEVSFFNVRNRAHGLAYNNQDARDTLAYAYEIYAIGVQFASPSTVTFNDSGGNPVAPQTVVSEIFEQEVPKHTSLLFRTKQDERLISTTCLCPSGYGPEYGGFAQGDMETAFIYPNVSIGGSMNGVSELKNVWGFPKPLKIPRTANFSVVLRFSSYAQNLLLNSFGPLAQHMRAVAADGTFYRCNSMAHIQVVTLGKRLVQQRGEEHA